MLYQVAAMVGQAEQGLERIEAMRAGLAGCIEAAASRLRRRPRVYFEEWDEPADQRHPVGVGADRHRRR
jgi:iron complex transport system substrate-binding protein